MPVQFQNYAYRYEQNGRQIFVPSDLGERIGEDIKAQVESAYPFDHFIYHLRRQGGHVAALHAHRSHQFFARLDIRRFFYGISRSRVRRALAGIRIGRALHYAKWSCVKNPYGNPAYALPYGFIQSPVLASLVLMQSEVGDFLRAVAGQGHVLPTVYMDDISLSSDDFSSLRTVFDQLLVHLDNAGFEVSPNKTRSPAATMDLFNCDLSHGQTRVSDDRINAFLATGPSQVSLGAFLSYCTTVEVGNHP
jgi:hypothetical protein